MQENGIKYNFYKDDREQKYCREPLKTPDFVYFVRKNRINMPINFVKIRFLEIPCR